MDSSGIHFMRWPNLHGIELPARVKGLLAAAIPLTALASLTLSMRVFQSEHKEADEQVWRSIAVQRQISVLAPALTASEEAVRDYASSGQDGALEQYRSAKADLEVCLRSLDQTVSADAARSQRVRRLRPLVDRQLEILSALRAYAAVPGLPSADAPPELLAESRTVRLRIRNLLAGMQEYEDEQMAAASVLAEAARAKAEMIVVGTVVIGFLGGTVAVWLFVGSVVSTERRRAQAAVRGSHGQLERMLASTRSQAAELAASERALRNHKDLLESVLEGLNDGVVVVGENGYPLLFNAAAARILAGCSQYPVQQWAGRYGLCLPSSALPCPDAEFAATRAARGEEILEQLLVVSRSHLPGGMWVHMSGRPLREETGVRGAVIVITDVTASRLHQETLSKAKTEAEQANKAKSEFLSRMSHELRTPLNAILGFAQLLEMARLKPAHRDSVRQILKAGRHLLSLINEVLDISRIEAGRLSLSLEPVQVGGVIREALAMVQPQAAESRVRIDSEAAAASRLYVLADRQRLKQVLLNLLSNAVKYNRIGGTVTVSCAGQQADRLRLIVSDTGAGIPEDKIGRLFSPFERLGAEQTGVDGTGIGLALSKRLAEAMGGTLGVTSVAGTGSTFFIDLPRADSPLGDLESTLGDQLAAAAEAITDGAGPTILCIEDNPSNLQLMEQILASRPGIRFLTALNGVSGLRLAQHHRPHLILLDVHLPDIDGREVLERLKDDPETSPIPVIVVSADATERQEARLRAAGARDYVTKPLDVAAFLEKVEEALQYAGVS